MWEKGSTADDDNLLVEPEKQKKDEAEKGFYRGW